jgi:acetyltransferase
MKPHYLTPFFAPQSIAIVGASDHSDSMGGQVLRNLLSSGFKGPLYPVNLHHDRVQDLPAYPRLSMIGQPVDLVMLATPAHAVPGLVEECGQLGLRSVVVLATDFAASGSEGRSLESRMVELANRHGVRILGPNCIGAMRPAIGLAPPFVKPGGVALVSQSTALSSGVLDWASGNEIGFSTVVSVGHSADIDFAEIIDFLVFDLQTQSILLFIESVTHPRSFMSALREAARVKPVIVLKADRRGALSPQGDLSQEEIGQSDAIFDAALRRAGVVRVKTLTQLFAAARACSVRYRKSGPRLAIISNGEGPGALAADQALHDRIPLARLSTDTLAELAHLMPDRWDGGNPLDLGNSASADLYRSTVTTVLADPGVDSLLVILSPQFRTEPTQTADILVDLAHASPKPVMACWMGDRNVLRGRMLLSKSQVPNFRTPESAVDAIQFVVQYHHNQQMLLQMPPPSSHEKMPRVEESRRIVRDALHRDELTLGDRSVEKLLAAFHLPYRAGVPQPPLLARLQERRAVIIGLVRDRTLGPALYLGPTGIAARLPQALSYALPPLNLFLARELIERSVIGPLLQAHGAIRRIDEENLVSLLLRLSEIACELPEVAEIHIEAWLSPDAAAEISQARVQLSLDPLPRHRYGHMAVHPYPVDLVTSLTLADGTVVTLRPIRPEDAEMEQAFVRSLSEDTRYMRFMDALRELPRAMLVRFTQLDYQREMAIVAVIGEGDDERQIGVARYTTNPDGESCEFAVVVADDWQGKGLGKGLMRYLMQIARNRGLKQMEGEVLTANTGMLHMVTELGFHASTSPDDPGLRHVVAPLEPQEPA